MKNKLKRAIIICIGILVILGLLIFLYQKKIEAQNQAREEYGNKNMGVYKEDNIQKEKNLEYKNVEVFNKFRGKLATSTMAKNIKDIMIREIPLVIQETKEISDSELNRYFEDNKEMIKDKIKIENYQSFKNMINRFTNLKSDLENDYKVCEFKQEKDYINIKFIYQNEEKVECRLIGDSIINFSLIF